MTLKLYRRLRKRQMVIIKNTQADGILQRVRVLMDPAKLIELKAKRNHKPMEELIARGDSPVQQFYKGTTVFITGGSGFLGKQLIEKLFRSCAIKKMYLLLRSRRGKTIEQRLQRILQETVFDRLRENQPYFADKIVPVEGDVADIRLGLSDIDWTKITKEVNILFHVAATVRFDEHLQKAILTNVRGTREALTFAKQCSEFKKFVHVSTAFSYATLDRVNKDVDEQFYPCPVSADTLIELAEELDSKRLDNITKGLIQGWPNTYTFTKAIGEEMVRTFAADVPVCIVRPSIVLSSYFEPNPGWLDLHTALNGVSGVYLASALGILRVFRVDTNVAVAMAPVDYVNNVTIAAAWNSTERKKNGQKDISVYNIAKRMRLGFISDTMIAERKVLSTKKSVWYTYRNTIKSKYLFLILSWFYHYIPGYCADFVLKILGKELPKGMVSFVELYNRINKLGELYNYYGMNEFNFKDNNIKAMIGNMSEADKLIFNCDPSNIDLVEFIKVWSIGLRKYIIKDKLEGTDSAYRKQKIQNVLHYFVVSIYIYILWIIFSTVYMFVKYVFFLFLC